MTASDGRVQQPVATHSHLALIFLLPLCELGSLRVMEIPLSHREPSPCSLKKRSCHLYTLISCMMASTYCNEVLLWVQDDSVDIPALRTACSQAEHSGVACYARILRLPLSTQDLRCEELALPVVNFQAPVPRCLARRFLMVLRTCTAATYSVLRESGYMPRWHEGSNGVKFHHIRTLMGCCPRKQDEIRAGPVPAFASHARHCFCCQPL